MLPSPFWMSGILGGPTGDGWVQNRVMGMAFPQALPAEVAHQSVDSGTNSSPGPEAQKWNQTYCSYTKRATPGSQGHLHKHPFVPGGSYMILDILASNLGEEKDPLVEKRGPGL
jgi:hypothetical protein